MGSAGVWVWAGGLVEFESVAGEGGIDFPGPGVDAPGEGEGVFQSVAAEPRAVVEDFAAGVVVEDDEAVRGGGEEFALVILGHEPGVVQRDRLVLLAGAGIDEEDVVAGLEPGFEFGRADEHFLVVPMAFEEFGDGVPDCDVVAIADRGEGLLIPVGTGLAAADVEGGKEGPAGSGEAGEDVIHAVIGLDRRGFVHIGKMAWNAKDSSLCVGRERFIVSACRTNPGESPRFISCRT